MKLDKSTVKYVRTHIPKADKVQRERRITKVTNRALIAAAEAPPEQPPEFAVPLLELEDWHCRWPYGEGQSIVFCGNARIEPQPYCAGHCKVAYNAGPRPLP